MTNLGVYRRCWRPRRARKGLCAEERDLGDDGRRRRRVLDRRYEVPRNVALLRWTLEGSMRVNRMQPGRKMIFRAKYTNVESAVTQMNDAGTDQVLAR